MPGLQEAGVTNWITGFKGLNDSAIPGASPAISPDLSNVKARYGRIVGRGGMTKYLSISTAAGNPPIVQLMPYPRSGSSTNSLLRMTLTKVEKLNTGTLAWDDVTGTALTTTNTTRPQFSIIDDTLVFTNEGLQVPRKYTGSGNTVNIGGSPPYCKGIVAYEGFLFLLNISTDGTFTDIDDGERTGRYSDDWDATWTNCGDASVTGDYIFDLTPGAVTGGVVLGRDLIVTKEDGIEVLTWTGGSTVFKQRLLPIPVGCTAFLTPQVVGSKSVMLLGTDGLIYRVTAGDAQPVSDEVLANTLHTSTIRDLARYNFARAMVDEEEGLYILLYDRTGLTQQFLNSYVAFNYITGEVMKGTLGQNVVACAGYRPSKTARQVALVSTNTLVEEFDSTSIDDDGTKISRHWTSGWQKLGGAEEGWFMGALVQMKKSKRGRIRVSVATDFDPTYSWEAQFSLVGDDPDSDQVEIRYTCPPIKGQWFNVKVELFHGATTAETQVRRIGFLGVPLNRVSLDSAGELGSGQSWNR